MLDMVLPLPPELTEDIQWPINVGMVSKLSGLTPKMVRHYEAQGLLGEIQRSGGGYRLYSRDDVDTLRFIQHCRSVDFSLDDTEKLLKMWREGGDNCLAAKELVDRHIELLECRIAEIEFMKQALRELTSQCGTGEDCPVIDSMSGKAAPPAKSPYHGCCGLTSSLRNV